MAKTPTITPSIERLINEALAIEEQAAQDAGALGFMARAMVMATLPHREVDGTFFERRNGSFSLSMMAHPKLGLPYGSVPRLLLAWLTTEAVRTKSRELELGDTLSGFMAELGLVPTGGRWGSITRLKEQSRRLFNSVVTASYEDAQKAADMGFRLTDKSVLWWDTDPNQAGLWKSAVTLSEPFFKEVIEHPIPLDLRVLKVLKQSPLAVDVYVWLSYRASYAKKASLIPWEALAHQFGADYGRIRDFKAGFVKALQKVALVYPAANFEVTDHGLVVKPTLPHIARKGSR